MTVSDIRSLIASYCLLKTQKFIWKPQCRQTMAKLFKLIALLALPACSLAQKQPAANRSTFIPYDGAWVGAPGLKWMALDAAHERIFSVWQTLDRVDVLSTADYHLIRSIAVPSPSAIDISPDGTTVAVGTAGSYVYFFNTATFEKTGEAILPDSGNGIAAFVYMKDGDAIVSNGETFLWDHATNGILAPPALLPMKQTYNGTPVIARSPDYSRVVIGESSEYDTDLVQIVDGGSGKVLFSPLLGPINGAAAGNGGTSYALCAGDSMLVLNAELETTYQDGDGCQGLVLSPDSKTLYREVGGYTQAIDTTTFAVRPIVDFNTVAGLNTNSGPIYWQAADSTGMLYGVAPESIPGAASPAWIALDTAAVDEVQAPVENSPVRIVRMIDNIGAAKGGDPLRILCTGVDPSNPGSVQILIGGKSATVFAAGGLSLPDESIVEVTSPAGRPGFADVELIVNGTSYTAPKSFQYAASRTIFPFATSPNFLLFDPLRNRLYAGRKDHVEVIDVASKKVLTPLYPASGKLALSQFAGLSLSPDSNRLYIADAGASRIHELELDHPGKGYSIDVGKALGASGPLTPERVFELSTGKLFGGIAGTDQGGFPTLFVIDLATGKGDYARDSSGNAIVASAWTTSNKGRFVLFSGNTAISFGGTIGLWDAESSENAQPRAVAELPEFASNEDGTAIAAGGSISGQTTTNPEIFDFSLNPQGFIEQHFDAGMPQGTPSFFLDPSGALLYKAGGNTVDGDLFPGGSIEIDDLHTFQPAASIAFSEHLMTSGDPETDHMATIDSTGKIVFVVTSTGVAMTVLEAAPLSIGNLQPGFLPTQAGQTVTVRGIGFVSGAAVSIGGVKVTTQYVDPNTLTVKTPTMPAGWLDVAVTLPSGSSYTAPGLLHVVAPQPAPVVTGFTPAKFTVQTGIAGYDTPANVTVVGTGFEGYDAVEINGQTVFSQFVDSKHMLATIPAALTGTAGSIEVAVVSPYTGSSKSVKLPMVNPLPVLQDNLPITVIPNGNICVGINGTGFVNSSKIQWNGKNLTTTLAGGETSDGIESVFASCMPAGNAGTVKITVSNPAPGGGVSSPIYISVAAAHPLLSLSLVETSNNNSTTNYFSVPSSINLGKQVVNATATYYLYLLNRGTANYTLSSVTVTSGPVSVGQPSCYSATLDSSCTVQLLFKPTAVGAFDQTLTIVDNVAGSPHKIKLTGSGIREPLPVVTLSSINASGLATVAGVSGSVVLGGSTLAATAWLEYGNDLTLKTFTKTPTWAITGDGSLSGNLMGLGPDTRYAVRFAVHSAAGTAKSGIQIFTTSTESLVQVSITGGNVASVTRGQTTQFTLEASQGYFAYNGNVAFSCSGAPVGAGCSVSPAMIQLSAKGVPIGVTVTTSAKTTPTGVYYLFVDGIAGGEHQPGLAVLELKVM